MAEFSSQRPRPHNSGMRVAPASWCSTSAQRLLVPPFLHSSDSGWWWIGIGENPQRGGDSGAWRRGDGAGLPLLLLLPILLPSLLAGAVRIERETQAAAEQGAAAGMEFKGAVG
jgi:hypothetical protein